MVFYTQQSLKKNLEEFAFHEKKMGFVPTMGALHEGHLALVKKALKENDLVIVSIFVNPTQFDNPSDLKKYPRTLTEDLRLLNTLKRTVLVYAPNASDLYGNTVSSKHYHFGGIENQMEGKFRKGHFNGVGTVLNLLFRAIAPHKAYFGEKDFQQLQIVKKLVKIEQLPVKIIGCPIKRETNGLAMSSRNKRLTQTQFEEASIIYKTLKEVQQNFDKKSIATLHKIVAKQFSKNKHLTLEYFEIAAIKNLKPAHRKIKENTYRAFIAAFAGEVRLIDNIALN
ncbi:MAG: pantoate--beta-alanine ligase [Flavobacteriaceae bacterium]